MKKYLLFAFCFLFLHSKIFAQNTWNPIGLSVSGDNTMNGVDALFQLNTCNGEDVVFMKLVNHNSYAVIVEWYPAVFTNDLKWIKKENISDKKSITLSPNSDVASDCSGSYRIMMNLLKDFSIGAADFMRFGTTNFAVIKN